MTEVLLDAVALTTLITDAQARGTTWKEARAFATEHQTPDLSMALAYLLSVCLTGYADTLNAWPDDHLPLDVARPATALGILQHAAALLVDPADQ